MIALTIRGDNSVRNELVRLGRPPTTTCDTPMAQTTQEQLPRNLTLHIGNEEALLERVDQSPQLTELVLAPVELHRRNIQRRLREAQNSKEGVQFSDPSTVGEQLLNTANRTTATIDRIDRLSMIRYSLSSNELSVSSPVVPSEPQSIEQVRTEIENVTGFHPGRLEAYRGAADGLTVPIDADATELLNTAIDVERALRQRTDKSVSDVELVRRATRKILATDGEIWQNAFPEVECVSLVGVSSFPAAHIDFLHAILDSTSVSIHIHCRRGTGSYLSQRVPKLLDVAEPGAVVFES